MSLISSKNDQKELPLKGVLATEGSELLKIHAFLSDQMLQHMMMILSMAKERPIIVLILLIALFGCNQTKMLIPICCQ
jgi:hypothetical protein